MYTLKNINNKFDETYSLKKREYNESLQENKKRNFFERIKKFDNKSKTAWAIVNDIKENKTNRNQINIDADIISKFNEFNIFFLQSCRFSGRTRSNSLSFKHIICNRSYVIYVIRH